MSITSTSTSRPNRLDQAQYDNKNKDTNAEYHLDFAKWAVASATNSDYFTWAEKLKVNKRFYKGDQWFGDEDIEAFLKDSSGQDRNRIKVVQNQIRPMVEQYRGNAIRLSVNATAKSVSPMARNRRDIALSKKLLKTEVANALPAVGEILREQDTTLGNNPEETEAIFNNLYVDEFTENMNELLRYSEAINKLPNMKSRISQSLALSGLGVVKAFNHGGHRRYKIVEPEDFLFDRDAREYDLTDSTFMGERTPMDPASIFEEFQDMTSDVRLAIERQSAVDSTGESYMDSTSERKYSTNRIPVYKMYWKDVQKFNYGWVKDPDGYDLLAKIDYTEPGEDAPKYTEADLIEPPKTKRNKVLFKGKKSRALVLDVVRFCSFIPSESLSTKDKNEKSTDLVLEYGLLDYQDTDFMDLSNVKFPYKAYCWGYVDGEIFSPVDDAIDPQRFINRIMSVFESQINNSGGAGVVIDESAIPANGADQVYHDINEGRPVTINTKGKGVPNTISNYDATPKSGTYGMLDIIPVMKSMIQESTGVNEALRGESTGSDQLVGVTEILVQKGSLMQEPFYDAISQIFLQVYQDIASIGKRFYIDHERELAIATGDDGVKTFKLSDELKMEDFRTFITRDNDENTLRNQANQILTMFLESELIGKETFANLYGRSHPEQVYKALRDDARLKKELERRQMEDEKVENARLEEEQNNLVAQEAQGQQEAIAQQEGVDNRNAQAQHGRDIDKINQKGIADMQKELAKNNEIEPQV